MSEKFMTIDDAAEYLGFSRGTIYNKVSADEIPYHKLSAKALRFKQGELDEWAFKNSRLLKRRVDNLINEDADSIISQYPMDIILYLKKHPEKITEMIRKSLN